MSGCINAMIWIQILAAVRRLGSGDLLIGRGRSDEADQPPGPFEGVRARQRIDVHRDHPHGPSAFDAVRSVVEKDDLLWRQPEVGGRLEIRPGGRLAFTEVGAVDEDIELGELRTAGDPLTRR